MNLLASAHYHAYSILTAIGGAYLAAIILIGLAKISRPAKTAWLRIFHPLALIAICECLKRLLFPEFGRIFNGIEIFLAAYLSVHLIVNLYINRYLVERRKLEISHIVRDTIRLAIIALFVIFFLRGVLDWNLAAILTPSAILTAIIGLAMQDTIGNFIAGLLIQAEKPFDLGDWIEVEDKQGQVRELNWRYTKIETLDQYYMIIPNSKIATQKVVNYSKPTPEVNEFLSVGVSYDVPPFKVKRAIETILAVNPNVVQNDNRGVFLHEYSDSSIVYKIKYSIRDFSRHREIRDEILSAIWYQFKTEEIEIPFPIRTVILKKPSAPPADPGLVNLLSAVPLFNGVDRANLANLLAFGLIRRIAPLQKIIEQDQEGDSAFFILAGEFDVFRDDSLIATLAKGDFFGEMSLFTGEKRNARVEAKARGLLLEIDRHAFKVLLDSEPAIMRQVDSVFNQRALELKEAAQSATKREEIRQTFLSRFKRLFGLHGG